MALEHHDLHSEFAEYEAQIHALKESDTHFRRLFDDYHEATKEIERIEAEGSNTSDEYVETQKKKRLGLKDELFAILQKQAA